MKIVNITHVDVFLRIYILNLLFVCLFAIICSLYICVCFCYLTCVVGVLDYYTRFLVVITYWVSQDCGSYNYECDNERVSAINVNIPIPPPLFPSSPLTHTLTYTPVSYPTEGKFSCTHLPECAAAAFPVL